MSLIKVLIVDDSALVRQTFKQLLETDSEIKVIATATDPYVAVQKIHKERPDVITLDIEMPKMDGLTFLKKLMSQAPMPVVVISNQTIKGADIALKALEVGAVDVMAKPNLSTSISMEESRISLIDKVRSAYFAGKRNKNERNTRGEVSREISNTQRVKFNINSLIALGASTGGTEAIKNFLERLPAEMPPILIVQHMPAGFTTSFAKRLNECCALHVKEAEHHEVIKPSTVYIAPGNHHMSVMNSAGKYMIRVEQGELVNRHRPSVNVLFNSVADCVGKNAIGIILTGMGDDGATGMLAMQKRGAHTIAQDEESSVVYGMPYKAYLLGAANDVLPLVEIPQSVLEHLKAED